MTLGTLTMTGDDFPGVWGALRGPIVFTILLATSIGDKMLYSDTVYAVTVGQNDKRYKIKGGHKYQL